jgi:hypothetical protein
VKVVGGQVWMALALAIPSRLWLGGVVSPRRDRALLRAVVQQVAACTAGVWGLGGTLLVCVDGLASYVTAFRRACRVPVRTGQARRPRLVLPAGFLLGQVVKRYAHSPWHRVVGVTRRVVCGTPAALAAALAATRGGPVMNTAYIERLNATFRAHLGPLVRRGRALAHTTTVLTAGMYLVGCADNFCWEHDSLCLAAGAGAAGAGAARRWQARTPAMAAGLPDHRWPLGELLHSHVPLPAWVAPKRRGRPPQHFAIRPVLPRTPAVPAPCVPTS